MGEGGGSGGGASKGPSPPPLPLPEGVQTCSLPRGPSCALHSDLVCVCGGLGGGESVCMLRVGGARPRLGAGQLEICAAPDTTLSNLIPLHFPSFLHGF